MILQPFKGYKAHKTKHGITYQRGDETNYIIINTKTNEIWTNANGWGEDEADIFNTKEKQAFNLPLDGEWKELQL